MTRSEAIVYLQKRSCEGGHRGALKRGRFHYVTRPHHLSELTAPLRKQPERSRYLLGSGSDQQASKTTELVPTNSGPRRQLTPTGGPQRRFCHHPPPPHTAFALLPRGKSPSLVGVRELADVAGMDGAIERASPWLAPLIWTPGAAGVLTDKRTRGNLGVHETLLRFTCWVRRALPPLLVLSWISVATAN